MTDREELAAWAENHARAFGGKTEHDRRIARIAALLREPPALPPEPPAGFVRCRAAVAVGRTGRYFVSGWTNEDFHGSHNASDDEMYDHVTDDPGEDRPRVSFVTFDAPLPSAPAEIVGKID